MDHTIAYNTARQLEELGAETRRIELSGPVHKGMYYRLHVFMDDDVEIALIRDADSRLNEREADAVRTFEESDKMVHIMRDHPAHKIPMMGGMWGAKKGFLPEFERLMHEWFIKIDGGEKIVWYGRHKRESDQAFLNNVIWKKIRHLSMAHDDTRRVTGDELPFNIKLNDGDFIGRIVNV